MIIPIDEQEKKRREEALRAKLDAYVQGVVDQAPPLTNEQRNKIAALLHPRKWS